MFNYKKKSNYRLRGLPYVTFNRLTERGSYIDRPGLRATANTTAADSIGLQESHQIVRFTHQGKSRRLHEFKIALLPISYNTSRQSSQVRGMDLEGEKNEKAQLLAKKKREKKKRRST